MEGDVGDVGVPGRLELGQQVEDEAHLVGGETQGVAGTPSRVVVVTGDQGDSWEHVLHTGMPFPDEEGARLWLQGPDPPQVVDVGRGHDEHASYALGFGGQAVWGQVEGIVECYLGISS